MEQKLLVPSAIVAAGVIIAGAIIYTKLPTTPSKAPGIGGLQAPGVEDGANPEALKIRQGDFVLGNPAAKVVLVEYGDFQCPFCGRFFKTTEQELKNTYIKEGKAALIWRDFAFLGEESFRAAEASRCAGEQGKFWEYHDHLFNNQRGENEGAFADTILKRFAQDLNLDQTRFNECFDSGKYSEAVKEQSNEGRTLGVNGTPATFVNGKLVSGAVPFAVFKQAIEEELKK